MSPLVVTGKPSSRPTDHTNFRTSEPRSGVSSFGCAELVAPTVEYVENLLPLAVVPLVPDQLLDLLDVERIDA